MKFSLRHFCWGLSLSTFSAISFASDATEAQMLQVLTQIQTQLQTLTTQQNQMAQAFQAYAQMQVIKDYPSIPFPGWRSHGVSTVQDNSTLASGGSILSSLLNARNASADPNLLRTQMLLGVSQSLSQPLGDSKVMSELNAYRSLIANSNQGAQIMTQAQAQQVTNQLLVLNVKAAYLNYQENLRLEELLGAQLFVESQIKAGGGKPS